VTRNCLSAGRYGFLLLGSPASLRAHDTHTRSSQPTNQQQPKSVKREAERAENTPGPGGALGDEVVAGEDELGDGEDALLEERGDGARGRDPLHCALVELVDLLLHLHRRPLLLPLAAWRGARTSSGFLPLDGDEGESVERRQMSLLASAAVTLPGDAMFYATPPGLEHVMDFSWVLGFDLRVLCCGLVGCGRWLGRTWLERTTAQTSCLVSSSSTTTVANLILSITLIKQNPTIYFS